MGEITRLCGYLPLAIGMLASQLRHHPAWTAAELAADLAEARDRLELMHAENLSVARRVRPVLRGPHPRPAAAVPPARPGPRSRASTPTPPPRSTTPAWPRPAATSMSCTTSTCSPSPHPAATSCTTCSANTPAPSPPPTTPPNQTPRPAGCWTTTCTPPLAAGRHFASWASAYRRPPPGHPPAQAPDLSTLAQAAAWLEAERANLHAAADYAAARGRSLHAIAIPAAIGGFLAARGHWDQSAALHQTALAAARQAGDRLGEADTLGSWAILQRDTGDLPGRRRQLGPGAGALR